MIERDKYIAMWGIEAYRSNSPGEQLVHEIVKLFSPNSSVIDFGAGPGRASQRLADLGYRVLAVDFAHNCLDSSISVPLLVADLTDLPELKADYGLCCDVMEHIPTEQVDSVLAGIARSVKGAFFSIALHPDSAGRFIGQRLHMTVESAQWWMEKIQKHWSCVAYDDRGHCLIVRV